MSKKHWLSRLVELYSIDLAYAARKQKVGTMDAEIKIFEAAILDTIKSKLPGERVEVKSEPLITAYHQGFNECLKAVRVALFGGKDEDL